MENDPAVEQIVRGLSFEVEAVPQNNILQVTTTSKSAPLNLKIRVRKKEEAEFQHGVMSMLKHPNGVPQRIRLVSSDQTIMSFNVVMEADLEKPINKPRKKFMGIFKPNICLGSQPDEDEYAYIPGETYKSEDVNQESTIKSEGALTDLNLSKSNVKHTSQKISTRKKDIFGKCKPGGCLDPPFGEDKYPYTSADTKTATKTPTKARTSSVFSNKLFTRKRKTYDDRSLDSNVIKNEEKTESVLDLNAAGSFQTSATYSHSIITYPPVLNSSELRIQDARRRSKIVNTISKNSLNVHSGSYFILPKKTINIPDNSHTLQLKAMDDNFTTDISKFEPKQEKYALRTKDSIKEIQLPADQIKLKIKCSNAEFSDLITKKESQSILTPTINPIPIDLPELNTLSKNDSRFQKNALGILTTGVLEAASIAVAGFIFENDQKEEEMKDINENDNYTVTKNLNSTIKNEEGLDNNHGQDFFKQSDTRIEVDKKKPSSETKVPKSIVVEDFMADIDFTNTHLTNTTTDDNIFVAPSVAVGDLIVQNNQTKNAIKGDNSPVAIQLTLTKKTETSLEINHQQNFIQSKTNIAVENIWFSVETEVPEYKKVEDSLTDLYFKRNPLSNTEIEKQHDSVYEILPKNASVKAIVKLDPPLLISDSTELRYILKPTEHDKSKSHDVAKGILATGALSGTSFTLQKIDVEETIHLNKLNELELHHVNQEQMVAGNEVSYTKSQENISTELRYILKPTTTEHDTSKFHDVVNGILATGALSGTSFTLQKIDVEETIHLNKLNELELHHVNQAQMVAGNEVSYTKSQENISTELRYILKPTTTEHDTSKFHDVVNGILATGDLSGTRVTLQKIDVEETILLNKLNEQKLHHVNQEQMVGGNEESYTKSQENILSADVNQKLSAKEPREPVTHSPTAEKKGPESKNIKTASVLSTGNTSSIINSREGNIQKIITANELLEVNNGSSFELNVENYQKHNTEYREVTLQETTVCRDDLNDNAILSDTSKLTITPNKTVSDYMKQSNDNLEINKLEDKKYTETSTFSKPKYDVVLNHNTETKREKTDFDIKTTDYKNMEMENDIEDDDIMANVPIHIEPPENITTSHTKTDDLQQTWDIIENKQNLDSETKEGYTDGILVKKEYYYPKSVNANDEHLDQTSFDDINISIPEQTDTEKLYDERYLKKNNEIKYESNKFKSDAKSQNFRANGMLNSPDSKNSAIMQQFQNEIVDQLHLKHDNDNSQLEQHEVLSEQISNSQNSSKSLNYSMSNYAKENKQYENEAVKSQHDKTLIQADNIRNDLNGGDDEKQKVQSYNVEDNITISNENKFLNNHADNMRNNPNIPSDDFENNVFKLKQQKISDDQKQQTNIEETSLIQTDTKPFKTVQQKEIINIKEDSDEFSKKESIISPIKDYTGLKLRAKISDIEKHHEGFQSSNQHVDNVDTSELLLGPQKRSSTNPAIFKINFGIQSFTDNNNEIVLKSFDLDKMPKRYLNDDIQVRTRYLKIDDELKIPIDSNNDFYIKIKRNIISDDGRLKDNYDKSEAKSGKLSDAHKIESGQIQRNAIYDDLQKMLEAVYEEELLPLRNTIAEMKHNMEMLTSQQLMLRGQMFIKIPRPQRIVPVHKCGCKRR